MSYSNLIVSNQYSGNDSDTSFNITFTFLEGEDQIGVRVYDTSGSLAVEVVPTPAHTIDEGAQQVNFTAPPTSDEEVVLYRISETTQEVEYNDYRFPFDTAERNFDRISLLVQEHDKMLETSGLKDYYNPNGNTPTAATPGTSGYNLVSHTTGTYSAASGDLVYLPNLTNVVTIELPATPTEGDEVVVKDASGAFPNKTVDGNGNTIIGEGATYALQSNYESTRLIYSSAGWLII